MSSTSQKSFSSRLGNAKKLKTIVSNFATYQPPITEASVGNLNETITQIEVLQTDYNNAKADYTVKTDERRKVFTENANSIDKQLAPIRAFVEALKGKDSTELSQVSSLIKKIRGQASKKVSTTDEENEEKTISQVERTYASRVANFRNIIDILTTLGPSYIPANTELTLPSLLALAEEAEASTEAVDLALATLKPIIEQRRTYFEDLSKQIQSIKNFVKAQYGQSSNEYKQIKGLSI
ncbi:hypothetical protein SAMN04489761_2598 [Tenacibaculum sp. MAR_2009_124]|uniref:hypothetical protein n=1 Tax=Tenacibaculum sp. MAR_2009_124 TaxID=1250059 RepID=UPI00089532D8|nr:hypothetical protein [Tenacibaculum sp. MAR_2009_124]SEC29332.1 hypothetical protein SAMN04489761_2598 [Tenacibaculum sp. MAR_2009_124]